MDIESDQPGEFNQELKDCDECCDENRYENRCGRGSEFKCVFVSRFKGRFEYGFQYGFECVFKCDYTQHSRALANQLRVDNDDIVRGCACRWPTTVVL